MTTVKQFLGDLHLFWEDFYFVFKESTLQWLKKIQVQITVFSKKVLVKLSGISNSKNPAWNLVKLRSTFFLVDMLQTWKFGGNDHFVIASFPSLIKDGNDNSFPQIHLHNTNVSFEDLTGTPFYKLAFKFHFLHTDLSTLHKWACFSTTLPPFWTYY